MIRLGQEMWAVQPLRYAESGYRKVVIQEVSCESLRGEPLAARVVIKSSMAVYMETGDRKWLLAMPLSRLFETEYEAREATTRRCLYLAMRMLQAKRKRGRRGGFELNVFDCTHLKGLFMTAETHYERNSTFDHCVQELFAARAVDEETGLREGDEDEGDDG